jgi:putative serine protease PepD
MVMSESDTTPTRPHEPVPAPEAPDRPGLWAAPADPPAAAPPPSYPQPSPPAYSQPGPPAPPYPQSGPPAQAYPQSGPPAQAYPQSGPPASGPPSIWQPQAAPGQTWYDGPGYTPPPGPPPGPPFAPTQPAPEGRSPRIGRVLATGLLALLLAGGGGVIGGVIVHASDSGTTGTKNSGSSSATRGSATALDRSSLAGIVAGVKDSVVSIFTQDAEGSGVVLDTNGYILTNNHVVADAQNSTVRVTFANGKSVEAKVVGTDAKTDMAVVKVSGVSDLSAAKFGDSNGLQVGDSVIAIGSPLGLDGSVTAGIVSALNRTIDESGSGQNPFSQQQSQAGTAIAGAVQTDAAINPGNSGGALVNMAGEVVGINTAIATGNTGSSGNIGVGFAIPSNRAKEVAQDLIKGQKVSHPYIGVSVGSATGNAGAQVASVASGGPASKGGVQQGDVITKAGSTDIHTSDDLLNVVQAAKVGDQLTLTLTRGGAQKTVTVTVGESPN